MRLASSSLCQLDRSRGSYWRSCALYSLCGTERGWSIADSRAASAREWGGWKGWKCQSLSLHFWPLWACTCSLLPQAPTKCTIKQRSWETSANRREKKKLQKKKHGDVYTLKLPSFCHGHWEKGPGCEAISPSSSSSLFVLFSVRTSLPCVSIYAQSVTGGLF